MYLVYVLFAHALLGIFLFANHLQKLIFGTFEKKEMSSRSPVGKYAAFLYYKPHY